VLIQSLPNLGGKRSDNNYTKATRLLAIALL
jgi:hypothetical protein